jgi:hypothetical protein
VSDPIWIPRIKIQASLGAFLEHLATCFLLDSVLGNIGPFGTHEVHHNVLPYACFSTIYCKVRIKSASIHGYCQNIWEGGVPQDLLTNLNLSHRIQFLLTVFRAEK